MAIETYQTIAQYIRDATGDYEASEVRAEVERRLALDSTDVADEQADALRAMAREAYAACAACGVEFAASPEGDSCANCGAGPLCDDCWARAGMKCGAACEAATHGGWDSIPAYFVVPAPGHYGDRARVLSAHETLEEAQEAAGPGYVVREGAKRAGDEWLRSSEATYPVVSRE